MSFSQKATIKGIVTDKDMNNEPLPFANVIVKGTKSGTTTDDKGNYSLSVDPGNLNVEFSFLGYETVVVPVVVKAGQTLTLNQILGSGEGVKLQDVVIATSRRKNTESALVAEIKEAKQVVSAISAEQISKGTDSNAAEAMMRIPGITLLDGKTIIVRGLPERYNNVLINGAIAPSTEIDRRAFSFDLVPANVLDKILVLKSNTADKIGDVAGGVLSITTSENFSEFTKVNIGVGYRTNTTFNDQIHSEKSSTDWLGFDNGLRTLPSSFPTTEDMKISTSSSLTRLNAGRSLSNNWSPSQYSTFFNTSTGFGLGRNINIGKAKLSSINALNYSQSYKTFERTFKEVQAFNNNGTLPDLASKYLDTVFEDDVKINVLSNWILKLNENHTIKFKNLFNQIGENETRLRDGFNLQQRPDDRFNNYMYGYRSRSILSSQFEGIHNLNSTNKLDWVIGYNYIRESEPDLRRFRTIRFNDDINSPFVNVDPPSSNLFDNSRYFGNLREFSSTNGLNFTHIIERVKGDEEFEPIKVKAGYLVDYKYRLFKSRYTSFTLPGNTVSSDARNNLINLPLNQIFSQDNINQINGWVLEEGTRPEDSYKADNFLTAAYIMTDLPLGKFDINAGVRFENNLLRLRNFNTLDQYVKTDKELFSVLPSLNIGYALNEKSQFRLAYSRSVNRPEFREIAEFLFYDFEFNALKIGNQNLNTATIDNIDFRYEYYPRKGETISLGGFYKHFKNPIENSILNVNEQRAFNIINAEKADAYGVELEFKKSFKDVFGNPFLDKLSLNANFAYIYSKVDLGVGNEFQDRTRALQGQSPYIINFNLGYEDESGFGANLIYNRFGDRIYIVGSENFPSILEKGRNDLDFTISKKFKKITLKATAQNILDAAFRFYDDTSKDFKINKNEDVLTTSYKIGTLLNLNISYNF